MSSVKASIATTVHPHQIEIQDFDVYDLIVDARSPREFAEDHLPGAVNLPVSNGRSRSRQTRSEAVVEEASTPCMRAADLDQQLRLRHLVSHLQPGAFILVYCARGGQDSEVWAGLLERMGFVVDVLGGGWPVYRRWAQQALEQLPRYLDLQGFFGAPMGGLEEFTRALVAAGEQVLVLDWVGAQASVPGFAWPAIKAIGQARFDTLLLAALRHLDPQRTAWVGWCWSDASPVTLPASLHHALARRPAVALSTSAKLRTAQWDGWLSDRETEQGGTVSALQRIASEAGRCGSSRYASLSASLGALAKTGVLDRSAVAPLLAEVLDIGVGGDFAGTVQPVELVSLEPDAARGAIDQCRKGRAGLGTVS